MNIQTIQIMILLLDGIIKLAPWRVVMEVMGRIGYRSRQNPVRGLRLAVSAITGLGAGPVAVHVEGHAGVHEFRRDDWQELRSRPRQSEEARRE